MRREEERVGSIVRLGDCQMIEERDSIVLDLSNLNWVVEAWQDLSCVSA